MFVFALPMGLFPPQVEVVVMNIFRFGWDNPCVNMYACYATSTSQDLMQAAKPWGENVSNLYCPCGQST